MTFPRQRLLASVPRQRVTAIGVVLVQSFSLALLMNSYVFTACVAVIAIAGLIAPQKKWTISLPGDRWVFVLGVLFFLKYYFAPREILFEYRFLLSEFAYEVASFCIVVELLYLYRKENEEILPKSFLAFAVIGLVSTGNVRLNRSRRFLMLIVVQVFLLLWMMFAVQSRREVPPIRRHSNLWRYSIMGMVLLLSAFLGTFASMQLYRHERSLENMIAAYLAIGDGGPARSGFSNRGGLTDVSSWRDYGGEKQSLRIESRTVPGYLRGKIFDEFHQFRWTSKIVSRTISSSLPPASFKLKYPGDNFYKLSRGPLGPSREMNIWPIDNETAGHCFAPMDTLAIACQSTPLALDTSRVITRPGENKVVPYSLWIGPQVDETAQEELIEKYLQLPTTLDSRVYETAAELFTDSDTAEEKIKAVRDFFQQNFQYQLGIRIPRGEDHLGYFLGTRAAAHCEYFATATAVLLRLGNVPTRYVTGFYSHEQNMIDKSWVARRKDAHAWVEAYDQEKAKWILVESTPEAGRPAPSTTTLWEHRRETLMHYFRKIQDFVARGNYSQAIWFILLPLFWLIGILGLAMGVALLWNRKYNATRPHEVIYESDSSELILERKKMDQEVRRLGLIRHDSETTAGFADRIALEEELQQAVEIANWYREYSACRFRRTCTSNEIDALRDQREQIRSGTRTP